MKKADRQLIFDKYEGRCAYCGCDLEKGWHIDHILPARRGDCDERLNRYGLKRGENSVENYNPACRSCNIWKSTLNIEAFREEIASQLSKVNRYSANYRNAKRFGLVQETPKPIVFYFESLTNKQPIPDEDDDWEEDNNECPICGRKNGHKLGCTEDDSPFNNLVLEGFD